MFFSHGHVLWTAASTAGTTFAVSGLGFRPKALRFYWMGLGSSTDFFSSSTHMRAGVGFAVGASDRRCVGIQDQDAVGTQVCTTCYRNDAVAVTCTSTPAVDGLLDLQSIDSDGFTLVVDDASPVDVSVFWEAWGSDDNAFLAAIGEISEPAATGDVDYECGFKPSVLMLAGVQGTAAANTVTRNDAQLMVGFATGSDDAQNVVVVGNDDDGSGTTDTDGYARAGECLAMIAVAGGNPSARAKMTGWRDRGFRLNWIARATTDRRTIYLAIAGGQWRCGGYLITGNSGGATRTVDGLGFRPAGVLFAGAMRTQSAAGTSTTEMRVGLGTATSPSSRRAMGLLSENGNATASEIELAIDYDSCLAFPSPAGAVQAAYDLDAVLADGFRVVVDTAGGVANEFQAFLAFGGANPLALNNYLCPDGQSGLSVTEKTR
jgi:hypothetical protein